MSESLRDNWPAPEEPLEKHHAAMMEGVATLQDEMILPADQRVEIAYVTQTTGAGRDAFVTALGNTGSGKTTAGKFFYGPAALTPIRSTDTHESLYGHVNVINAKQFIPGHMKGLTATEQEVLADEVSTLADPSPINKLYDEKSIVVNGIEVPLDNLVVWATSNYPDGGKRVKSLDLAFRSRTGLELIFGDNTAEVDEAIHGLNGDRVLDFSKAPLLPSAATRRVMHEMIKSRYPAADLGPYVRTLIDNLNAGGLVTPLVRSDARNSRPMYQAARARMFLEGMTGEGNLAPKVTPYQAAHIAALVLPKAANLSPLASARLNSEAGRRVTPFEQGVALRVVIAKQAFETLQNMGAISESEASTMVASGTTIAKKVTKHTYANLDTLSFDAEKALFGSKITEVAAVQEKSRESGRKLFRRNRA